MAGNTNEANDNVIHHGDSPDKVDEVGEAVGGVSGVLAGAAIGSAAGPIGTIIGGIAGAVGGWWAGRSVSEASAAYSKEDDSHYSDAYSVSPYQLADRSYDDIRPAYQLGHLARQNPDYNGRDFDLVDPELKAGWAEQVASRYGDWGQVREYAREAYTRDFSVAEREAALRDRASGESLNDRVDNSGRTRANRVAGAFDEKRDDKGGDEGTSEARLSLPVSRR